VLAGSEDLLADSLAAQDSVALDTDDLLDTVETPDSDEMHTVEAPNFVEVVPDSLEMPPDSVEVKCPRCGTFHASGIFGETCYQARQKARRCAHCGLLHEDYDLAARVCDKMETFDCEVYIPDVHKLQMIGDTILLSEHVIKKLDEHYNMKKLKEQKLKQLESQDQ
jgi:hypothetical protein